MITDADGDTIDVRKNDKGYVVEVTEDGISRAVILDAQKLIALRNLIDLELKEN